MNSTIPKSDHYKFSEFILYPTERILLKDNTSIPLTPKVFELLLFLVENQNRLLTKDEILEKVWTDTIVEEGTLARTVSMLRKALGNNSNQFVETVPKKGYRFRADVNFVSSVTQSKLAAQSQAEIPISDTSKRAERPFVNKNRVWIVVLSALILSGIIGAWAWKNFNFDVLFAEKNSLNVPKAITNTPFNERFLGWTQDGKILFDRGETNELFFINADGTDEQKATDSIPVLKNGWLSPDKTKVVFQKPTDKAFYLANADGSNELKLEFSPENMAWSADGKKIVFQGNLKKPPNPNNPEIYIYELENKSISQITQNDSFDGDPSFSPDGKEIVFASDRDKNLEIYLINDDGTNPRRLTDNPAHDSFPKFTPDGTQITFNSNLDSETTDIYLMNKNGQNIVRLTDWKSNEISRGGISPDGTKLAFNSNHTGKYQIFVLDVEPFAPQIVLTDENDLQTPSYAPDGAQLVYSVRLPDKTGELRILNLRDGENRLLLKTSSSNNYPRWSPDGEWIAFHQEVAGKWDIFKIRKDGSELTNLTDNAASDSLPNWLPDGKSLIFRTTRDGDAMVGEVYRMNADGSDQTRLNVQKGYLGWSIISPDGAKIIYSSNRQQLRGGTLDIYGSDAAGNNENLLLARAGDNIHAAFSKDGNKIAFVSKTSENSEIYLMNADGTNLLRLTRKISNESNPAFSPDGKTLIFTSNRNGKSAIYSIDLSNINN